MSGFLLVDSSNYLLSYETFGYDFFGVHAARRLQLFDCIHGRRDAFQRLVPSSRMNRRVQHFGAFKRQRFVNGANDFAGTTVCAGCLVNLNFPVLQRLKCLLLGKRPRSPWQPSGHLDLVNGDFSLKGLAHLYDACRALVLASPAGGTLLFRNVNAYLNVFPLAGRQSIQVLPRVSHRKLLC